MGAGTKAGVLMVGAVAAVAVFGGQQAIDNVLGLFGGQNPVIVGEGDQQIMVPGGAESDIKQCTSDQLLRERKCGETKVLVLDAERMPFITRNVQLAWTEGQDYILTRNSPAQRANRTKACGKFVRKFEPKGSCDEYPFATTDEGGSGARVEEVHRDEQNCQGGMVSRGYQLGNIDNGDKFVVIISHPSKIASGPWQGEEVKSQVC